MPERNQRDTDPPLAWPARDARPPRGEPGQLSVAGFLRGQLLEAWWPLSGAITGQLVFVLVAMATTRMIGNAMEAASHGAQSLGALCTRFALIAALLLFGICVRRYADRAVMEHILTVSCAIVQQGYERAEESRSEAGALGGPAGQDRSGATVRKILRARQNYDVLVSSCYFSLLPAALGIPFAIGVTALDSWPGALAMLICLTPMLFATTLFGRRHVTPLLRESARLDSRLSAELSDVLGNHATVTSWDTHHYETGRLQRLSECWRERTAPAWGRLVDNAMLQNALSAVTLVVPLAVVAAELLARHGNIAAATTVVGASFVLRSSLGTFGKAVRDVHTSLSDLHEYVDLLNASQPAVAQRELAAFRAAEMRIRFDAVDFHYPGRRESGVRALDVAIEPNQTVGVVGGSGSGKTTFLKLILGIHVASAGRVTVDGQDVAQMRRGSLRRHIALVAQDTPMFQRTLLENMTYGIGHVRRKTIDAVVRAVGLDVLVASLSDGYATMVGERGASLSGGERQRVAIARALLSNRRLLIFDEATANLDIVTEARAQAAIERFAAGRTCIIVAHRLSTVRHADRILVFSEGRIVADGSHDELVRRGDPAYRRLLGEPHGAPPREARPETTLETPLETPPTGLPG